MIGLALHHGWPPFPFRDLDAVVKKGAARTDRPRRRLVYSVGPPAGSEGLKPFPPSPCSPARAATSGTACSRHQHRTVGSPPPPPPPLPPHPSSCRGGSASSPPHRRPPPPPLIVHPAPPPSPLPPPPACSSFSISARITPLTASQLARGKNCHVRVPISKLGLSELSSFDHLVAVVNPSSHAIGSEGCHRYQTSSTILPRVCPASLSSCASRARSSGNVRSIVGRRRPSSARPPR